MATTRLTAELPGMQVGGHFAFPAQSLITPNQGNSPCALPTIHSTMTGCTGTQGVVLNGRFEHEDGPPTGGAVRPPPPAPGVSSGPGLWSPLGMNRPGGREPWRM